MKNVINTKSYNKTIKENITLVNISNNEESYIRMPLKTNRGEYVVANNYKINTCIIGKTFSSMQLGVFCYLYDKKNFLKKFKYRKNKAADRNMCKRYNRYYKMDKVIKTFMNGNNTKFFKEWKNLLVVREPISRFISGFVQLCVLKIGLSNDHPYCYKCEKNMYCFLKRLYYDLINVEKGKKKPMSFIKYHFYPQTWQCEYSSYKNNYSIIHYDSYDKDKFYKKYLKELESSDNEETMDDYIELIKIDEKYNYFKYSTNVTNQSLILINLHLVEKELQPNIYSHFIYAFGFAQCIPQYTNKSSTTLILYDKTNNFFAKAVTSTVGTNCPWNWAVKCKWHSFKVVFSIPKNVARNLSNVTIFNLHTKIKVNVKVRRNLNVNIKKNNMTICVPPLYWYNNFLQIFIFTEVWKFLGASNFIYYYYTVSEDVMNLLKYYESTGIVTLIPYKTLPSSKLVDPNKSIYRYGHIAAINDCILRGKSKYLSIVDVDEFLHLNDSYFPSEKNLYEHIDKIFEEKIFTVGFMFYHRGMEIYSQDIKDDFKFLKDIYLNSFKGPPKYIIRPERVETVDSHYPFNHMHYALGDMNIRQGYLLHSRSSWTNYTNSIIAKVSFISSNQRKELQKKYLLVKEKLNIQSKFMLQNNILDIMSKCLKNWKIHGCKVPNDMCKKKILHIEKWVKSDDNLSSENYTIL
ncbi:Sulfotransferase family and Domain of unknown function DUF23 domain-containing protein [Strongyloides ratti]|uniref:Glycosyltransferase family 92 protein n=1 Tax=Strongyloides ratti TaxID=34506 RepID=A0A090LRD4_STRRB|nr:Sulfotransferase family and Domain of unknown function DUF23 domain-containing protein [Strongyloides ratti]CEF70697.1 Sulfotransferase family and Domain of unknown function DUF23 domain-containing protein [Strongyloides ratti]